MYSVTSLCLVLLFHPFQATSTGVACFLLATFHVAPRMSLKSSLRFRHCFQYSFPEKLPS